MSRDDPARLSEKGQTMIPTEQEIDVLCLISDCPQVNNPCNGFSPAPLRVVIHEAHQD
jgi:uncharacterized protein YcgI (DUF1989 family)